MKILLVLTFLQIPQISKYLSFAEATQSSVHAVCIPNASALTSRQLYLIQEFGKQSFDPLRIGVGGPLYVSSLFRSQCINAKVGGARNSEHMVLGDVVAVDIDQDGRKTKIGNRALFFYIKDNIPFRKLIWEFSNLPPGSASKADSPRWVHYSWSIDPSKNIGKVYRASKVGNRTVYTVFNTLQ